tara:strand:- start:1272 stop:1532 length:261 start_codon:yes stop_codon:yes gene_type:complete
MKYVVYLIITSAKNKTISYVGYTNNIEKRLKLHNSDKGAKFTKGRKWKLIYSRNYKDKVKALKEEYKLKKNYKLRKIIKNKFLQHA